MLNIIGRKNIFLGISGALVLAAIFCMAVFGFRQGIDFSGGALWRFTAGVHPPAIQDVEGAFTKQLGLTDVKITSESTDGSFLARMPAVQEADHQKYGNLLAGTYPGFKELSFQSIGPSVGADLRQKALIAIALVLVGISLYIAFAFRKVYRPVSSWKYGWITLITLLHDVAIPAGFLALLGNYRGVEIDGNFVVALLVIMGFSVHDTIVVFDRIRENLSLDRGKTEFGTVVNHSVNQTIARSINTSLTLILVLVALYFTGPVNLRYFILTLLLGVTAGIYSSIFVASPLLLVWHNFSSRREKSANFR
jgi:preprotein translocase subunit SecF